MLKTKQYTEAEYLKLEEKAEFKNEYLDGEIIPMVGATPNHNQILGNFVRKLPPTINDQAYYIYTETVRLWMPEYNLYTYPDIMVIKGKPLFHGTKQAGIINPLIIVEVLSTSTKAYDRGKKFQYYRSIPTFVEYIVVDQYSYYVEQYIKEAEDKWSVIFSEGEQATLQLASVNWSISLQELYERVDFVPEEDAPEEK